MSFACFGGLDVLSAFNLWSAFSQKQTIKADHYRLLEEGLWWHLRFQPGGHSRCCALCKATLILSCCSACVRRHSSRAVIGIAVSRKRSGMYRTAASSSDACVWQRRQDHASAAHFGYLRLLGSRRDELSFLSWRRSYDSSIQGVPRCRAGFRRRRTRLLWSSPTTLHSEGFRENWSARDWGASSSRLRIREQKEMS